MHHKKAIHHMKKAMDHLMKHHEGIEHSKEEYPKKSQRKAPHKKPHSRRSPRGM